MKNNGLEMMMVEKIYYTDPFYITQLRLFAWAVEREIAWAKENLNVHIEVTKDNVK